MSSAARVATRALLGALGLSMALLLGACGGGGSGGAGATMVAVPNVAGLAQSAATTAITGAGLMLGTVTTQASTTVASGDVISQSPAAGTSVATGASVALTVSSGSASATVPNLAGDTQTQATAALTAANLTLGTVTTQASGTVGVGLVISQSPQQNTSVASGSAVSLVLSSGTGVSNTLAIVVDGGPPSLISAGEIAANEAFATVTICTPGSTTACQVIDHVLVDTGSVGLQILAEAITGANPPVPTQTSVASGSLRECVQFADGYAWGSVAVADVTIGQRKISNLPIHLIGDAPAGTAPSSCSTGAGPSENTVATFGSNGVLGIGYFLQDCGTGCATTVVPDLYYGCASSCTEVMVATNLQVQNPVGAFSADNNGVMIALDAVPAPGAATVAGTLYFGVGTQPNNALNGATFYPVDPNTGFLNTTFGGTPYNQSFIDSGSNAYFFASSTLPACTTATGFFCPSAITPEMATLSGFGGTPSITIPFNVDSAEKLFGMASLTAFPELAGSNALPAGGTNSSFDWGLPFFFGRPTFVLFETFTVSGTLGPASAF